MLLAGGRTLHRLNDSQLFADSTTLSGNKAFLSSCHQSIRTLRSLSLLQTHDTGSRHSTLNAKAAPAAVLPTLSVTEMTYNVSSGTLIL